MLTIDHLYFSYTGKAPWLLEDISLHVEKGEYISIVGNNGSGKSTLLKLILGFLNPSKGTLTCRAKRIGYVPQMPARDQAFPITVEEVIHSYGKLLHLPSIPVKDILSITGMEGFSQKLMGNLSGGQHQKVLIARLNKEKKLTVLSVEHNMVEAGKVSSQLYHVTGGKGHLCSVDHYIKEYIEKEGGHV